MEDMDLVTEDMDLVTEDVSSLFSYLIEQKDRNHGAGLFPGEVVLLVAILDQLLGPHDQG